MRFGLSRPKPAEELTTEQSIQENIDSDRDQARFFRVVGSVTLVAGMYFGADAINYPEKYETPNAAASLAGAISTFGLYSLSVASDYSRQAAAQKNALTAYELASPNPEAVQPTDVSLPSGTAEQI